MRQQTSDPTRSGCRHQAESRGRNHFQSADKRGCRALVGDAYWCQVNKEPLAPCKKNAIQLFRSIDQVRRNLDIENDSIQ